MKTHQTIKQVRFDLKRWGNFWLKRELGKGYRAESLVVREGQPAGGFVNSDAMFVPPEIDVLTEQISKLNPQCIKAIRAKYMMPQTLAEAAHILGFDSKRSIEFWLNKAERTLMTQCIQ